MIRKIYLSNPSTIYQKEEEEEKEEVEEGKEKGSGRKKKATDEGYII